MNCTEAKYFFEFFFWLKSVVHTTWRRFEWLWSRLCPREFVIIIKYIIWKHTRYSIQRAYVSNILPISQNEGALYGFQLTRVHGRKRPVELAAKGVFFSLYGRHTLGTADENMTRSSITNFLHTTKDSGSTTTRCTKGFLVTAAHQNGFSTS